MAIPTDIAGLYAWYKASSLSLVDGAEVATWLDSSGNGRTMTGATGGAAKPKYRANQIAGYPAVELGTTVGSGYFTCVGFGWLTALASHTVFVVWRPRAAGDGGIVTAVGGGNLSEAILRPSANVIRKRWTNTVPTLFTADATLNDLEWHYACGFQAGTTQIGISVDGGAETTTGTSGTRSASVTNDARMGQDGSTYCDGWLAEVIIYSSSLSGGDKALINAYLREKYFSSSPGQIEQNRDRLSRDLWLNRRTPRVAVSSLPLWVLDADVLDRVAIQSQLGPSPLANGWRARKWEQRPFAVLNGKWNPATNRLSAELLDLRPLDVLYYDSSRTDEKSSLMQAGGVARISKGNAITFSRQSVLYLPNPSDPTAVCLYGQNERGINRTGEYFEEARTNELLRSSFVSGTTGLTLTGTGTNGSAIAADTSDLMFDSGITGNSLKFTAGSPHAADLKAAEPATASFTANQKIVITADHVTNSGEALALRIQRSVDSWYWNNGTGAWQAGVVDNVMTSQATRDPDAQWRSKVIDVGGSATTVTVTALLPTGGTAGRISHLYHLQLEKGTFPTSRIVTDGAAVTRVKTQLSIAVPAAQKIYNPALGFIDCEVVCDWSSSDLGSTEDMYVFWMTTNAGADHECLFYDASAGAWVFEKKVGASTYQATKTASVTRGTAVKLSARWTGADGELDLTNYTLSLFVDDVKGTDVTAAAPTFSAGGETLYRCSDSSFAHQLNGALRELRIRPFAPMDEEIPGLR